MHRRLPSDSRQRRPEECGEDCELSLLRHVEMRLSKASARPCAETGLGLPGPGVLDVVDSSGAKKAKRNT